METDLIEKMPCHKPQLNNSESPEHASKHVRFARSSSTATESCQSESVPHHIQTLSDIQRQIGPQLKLLPLNDQIRELQTIIRDKSTSRGDFVFCADRLIRLVVEEGLNQLPYSECTVTTPTGHKYEGVKFEKGNCGVSIMRSGEAMEQGLRDCCRSIRIGKILIQSDEETQKAKVFYAKFPPDISRRKVLLMYPILSTGNTVIEAVRVLNEHGLQAKHIILLSLFSTPHGARSIIQEFPDITILTTEVHAVAPTHFGQRYFGTD
ncbi:uracil phosphoribosyltransferase homolog isoform X1 [Xyrauchen texanus]|uniref:uracil phosphoribosyltransferase homolog isoform X1 n=1 Tax=Xyrauchen texanus TaxID=154827 RepID=UPI002241D636|nr:uracil phosphoribosyltransferase homolog isoform X1 [Xyrauchen texanus]